MYLSDLITSCLLPVGCYLHCFFSEEKDCLTLAGSDGLLTLQVQPAQQNSSPSSTFIRTSNDIVSTARLFVSPSI